MTCMCLLYAEILMLSFVYLVCFEFRAATNPLTTDWQVTVPHDTRVAFHITEGIL